MHAVGYLRNTIKNWMEQNRNQFSFEFIFWWRPPLGTGILILEYRQGTY